MTAGARPGAAVPPMSCAACGLPRVPYGGQRVCDCGPCEDEDSSYEDRYREWDWAGTEAF